MIKTNINQGTSSGFNRGSKTQENKSELIKTITNYLSGLNLEVFKIETIEEKTEKSINNNSSLVRLKSTIFALRNCRKYIMNFGIISDDIFFSLMLFTGSLIGNLKDIILDNDFI